VHIEKTAGRTVRAVLLRSFGSGHCEIRTPYAKREPEVDDRRVAVTGGDLRKVRRFYRNLRGIAGHNVKAYSDLHVAFPEVRYFTWLRDPVKRYLSHFKNRSRAYAREDFERWADTTWTHDWQTRMIAGEPNRLRLVSIHSDEILSFRFGTETAVARWTPVARDGADLPSALRVTRSALVSMGPGETADFSYVPARPGPMQLEVWIRRGIRIVLPVVVEAPKKEAARR